MSQDDNSRPWPVYGQPGSSPNPYGPPGGQPSGGVPEQVPASSPWGSGYPGYPDQQPPPGQQPPTGGMPYPGAGYPQPGMPHGTPPGRTGPIVTIVLGAVTMLVIAPVVAFFVMMAAVPVDDILDGSVIVYDGDSVSIGEEGRLTLFPDSLGVSCDLIGQDGKVTPMQEDPYTNHLEARGLEPGIYQVDCEGLSPEEEMLNMDFDDLFSVGMKGLVVGTVLGVGGLVALIVGIVWLVKRNKQRKAFFPPVVGNFYG